MAKRYILKIRTYAIVDGVKQACYVVADTAGSPYVEVWPDDDTVCATRAAAKAKMDELNGV